MPIIEYHHPIGSGLTLVCELEYYPADPGQPDPEQGDCCPPHAASTFLCAARVNGVDVKDWLSDASIKYLEERACVCCTQH